jgi:predicted secreted protein
MKKLTLVLLGTALGLTACVSTPKPTQLPQGTHSYNVDTACSNNLHLKVGETITVKVYDNPSTGYSWNVVGAEKFDVQSAYIKAVHDSKKPIMVGAGQDKTFIFTAKQSGMDSIALHHGRSWEGQPAAQWACKVTIE